MRGEDLPGWVLDALPGLPRTMARTGQRASAYERAIVDVVEAALLSGRAGEEFAGVVVDVEDDRERERRLERDGGDGAGGTRRGQVVLADPRCAPLSRVRTSRSATRSAPRCARRRSPSAVSGSPSAEAAPPGLGWSPCLPDAVPTPPPAASPWRRGATTPPTAVP